MKPHCLCIAVLMLFAWPVSAQDALPKTAETFEIEGHKVSPSFFECRELVDFVVKLP